MAAGELWGMHVPPRGAGELWGLLSCGLGRGESQQSSGFLCLIVWGCGVAIRISALSHLSGGLHCIC